MKPFREVLATTDTSGKKLVPKAPVAGAYQIGGNTQPLAWAIGAAPSEDVDGTLAAGVVHTLYLERDEELWVGPSSSATASTVIRAWLLWSDED